jgi:hypothetical protein
MEPDHKIGIKTDMALMYKTYIQNLSSLKILKESIDMQNFDKIPFYVVVPAKN